MWVPRESGESVLSFEIYFDGIGALYRGSMKLRVDFGTFKGKIRCKIDFDAARPIACSELMLIDKHTMHRH